MCERCCIIRVRLWSISKVKIIRRSADKLEIVEIMEIRGVFKKSRTDTRRLQREFVDFILTCEDSCLHIITIRCKTIFDDTVKSELFIYT